MTLKIWHECACGCGERHFLTFVLGGFSVRWFMDCGEWFFYVNIETQSEKRYYRFSSAGYLSGAIKK